MIELNRDILERFVCPVCKAEEPCFTSLGRIKESQATCPHCQNRREVKTFFTITGKETFLDRKFSEIGLPPFDIVWIRSQTHFVGIEFGGDAAAVLGNVS